MYPIADQQLHSQREFRGISDDNYSSNNVTTSVLRNHCIRSVVQVADMKSAPDASNIRVAFVKH